MRMNKNNNITAKTVVNEFSERELSDIFIIMVKKKILEKLQNQ